MISCFDGIGHYPGLLTEVPSFKAGRQKSLIAGSYDCMNLSGSFDCRKL